MVKERFILSGACVRYDPELREAVSLYQAGILNLQKISTGSIETFKDLSEKTFESQPS